MNRPDDEPINETVDLHAFHKNFIEITEMQMTLLSAQLSLKMCLKVDFCEIDKIIEFYETSHGVYAKLNYQNRVFIFIAESRRI